MWPEEKINLKSCLRTKDSQLWLRRIDFMKFFFLNAKILLRARPTVKSNEGVTYCNLLRLAYGRNKYRKAPL